MMETTQTDAKADQFMTMQAEAEAYANGAWECEVAFVCEGNSADSERFFDLTVPGTSVPGGLLMNLQQRGYTIVSVSAGDDEVSITASPDK